MKLKLQASQRLCVIAAGAESEFDTLVKKLGSALGGIRRDDGEDGEIVFINKGRDDAGVVFSIGVMLKGKDVRIEGYFGVMSKTVGDGGHFTGNTDDDVWKFISIYQTGKPAAVLKALTKQIAEGKKAADSYLAALNDDIKAVKDAQKILKKLG